jgi:hexosaminidase
MGAGDMKRALIAALFSTAALLPLSAAVADAPAPALIPLPAELHYSSSQFILNDGDSLNVRSGDPQAFAVAGYFADLVARTRGLKLKLPLSAEGKTRLGKMDADNQLAPPPAGAAAPITFTLDKADSTYGAEGYRLQVDVDGIRVTAATPAGLFYGAVTLWQLLVPYGAHGRTALVQDVEIKDEPRYRWRGFMLDSARHFQSVTEIEKLIDWMALHKLNVLQWHLTDDQGWRLEIRKYPKLTAIGGCRQALGPDAALTGSATKPYCGSYTQAEAREIVAYAAARHITVVPEIEMPGHAQAAIAAYPELGVTGERPQVSTDWGVHPYLYRPDAATLRFLEDVLDEVMALFPSTYIDVGGDEALKDQWKASATVQTEMHALKITDEDALQGWFITQIGGYLAAHGRRLIGWDGILTPGLPQQAAVMVWQDPKYTREALAQGHDVVLAYAPTLYLDYEQSAGHDEPPGRPTVVSLKDVYGFQSMDDPHILGEQLNLWTEYMPSFARDENALFPRLAAFAEDAWSPAASRDWDGFFARLPAELARYDSLGIQYAKSDYAGGAPPPTSPDMRNSDELSSCSGKLVLRIEGARPLDGPRPVYRVDIMDTCWLWKGAPLDGMTRIDLALGDMPWNYQLAHDITGVVTRPTDQGRDALEVHLDSCDGKLLAEIPLTDHDWLERQVSAKLPSMGGSHDLCVLVDGDPKQRLWALDWLKLSP